MSTLTFDIATILEDNGFGTIGTDIFVSQDVPPKPDATLNIIGSGSFLPDFPSIDLEYPTIQIIARGSKGGRQACEDRIYNVKRFLNRVANYYVNQSKFVFINHQSGPADIGLDTTMRPMYSLNVLCLRSWPFELLDFVGTNVTYIWSKLILYMVIRSSEATNQTNATAKLIGIQELTGSVGNVTYETAVVSKWKRMWFSKGNVTHCHSDLTVT